MLPEQTMEKLYAMKLNGMADAWEEQRQQPHSNDLSFDERLALLVERQWIWKENRALTTRLQYAHLKQTACLEDLDFRQSYCQKLWIWRDRATKAIDGIKGESVSSG